MNRPSAEVRVLTWNTNLPASCSFVAEAAKQADVLCLQEVTSASAQWLQENLGQTFQVTTPESCGGAWDTEGHGESKVSQNLPKVSQ